MDLGPARDRTAITDPARAVSPSPPSSLSSSPRKRNFDEMKEPSAVSERTPGRAPRPSPPPLPSSPQDSSAQTTPGLLTGLWTWFRRKVPFITPEPSTEPSEGPEAEEPLGEDVADESDESAPLAAKGNEQRTVSSQQHHVDKSRNELAPSKRLKVNVPGVDVSPSSKARKVVPATEQLPSPQSSNDDAPAPEELWPRPSTDKKTPYRTTDFRPPGKLEQPYIPKAPNEASLEHIFNEARRTRDKHNAHDFVPSPSVQRGISFRTSVPPTPLRMGNRFSRIAITPRPSDSVLRKPVRLSVKHGAPDRVTKRRAAPAKSEAVERIRTSILAQKLTPTRSKLRDDAYLELFLKDAIQNETFQTKKDIEFRRAEREKELRRWIEENQEPVERIPPLSGPELDQASKIAKKARIEAQHGQSVEYVSDWGISIASQELVRLGPGQWLNDNIMDFYLHLICDRASDSGRKMQYMSTFFFTNLRQHGYQKVSRWARRKKCAGKEMLKLDCLFVPVNEGNSHWTMSVINFKKKRIEYYDSLLSLEGVRRSLGDYAVHLKDYLKKETGMSDVELAAWTEYTVSKAPKQDNGSDCGVFALKTAEIISREKEVAGFTPQDIANMRKRMYIELTEKRLLP